MFLSFYLFSRPTFSCPLSLSLSGETHFPPLQDCFSHKMEMEKTNKQALGLLFSCYAEVYLCSAVQLWQVHPPTAKWLFLFFSHKMIMKTQTRALGLLFPVVRCICAFRLWQEPPLSEEDGGYCTSSRVFIKLLYLPVHLSRLLPFNFVINVCTCNKCGADSTLLLLFCCCC